MMTLITSLLSFLASGVPKIIDFFQNRQDSSHELEMAKIQANLQLELQKAGFVAQQHVEEIRTDQIEAQAAASEAIALYQHDAEIGKGASQWVINMRDSVRPVITYGLFILMVAVEIATAWYGWRHDVDFKELRTQIWGEDMQLAWIAVLSFWFGSRVFSRK